MKKPLMSNGFFLVVDHGNKIFEEFNVWIPSTLGGLPESWVSGLAWLMFVKTWKKPVSQRERERERFCFARAKPLTTLLTADLSCWLLGDPTVLSFSYFWSIWEKLWNWVIFTFKIKLGTKFSHFDYLSLINFQTPIQWVDSRINISYFACWGLNQNLDKSSPLIPNKFGIVYISQLF